MAEIPEALGRPVVVEYVDARREAGTITRAFTMKDGSVQIDVRLRDGFASYVQEPLEGRIVTEGEQIRPLHSPDCRDGNCQKCEGSGWDLLGDQPADCGCEHHGS